MNKRKLMAGVLVVFLLGALAGALGAGLYYNYSDSPSRFRHHSPEERTALIMKRLSRDLDLTETQQQEITVIIREAEEKVSRLKQQTFPEFKAIIDASFAASREKLNPEQQKKLDEIQAEMQQMRRKDKGREPD
jgi:Spy/CpxP family protein refolding chaperone